MQRSHNTGVTLIELMVVVVVIAILAGIAYPSYRQYVIRANRTEAKTALLQVVQGLEKCYTSFNAYNDGDCAVETDFTTPSGNYVIQPLAADPIAANTYTLTAIPQAGQAEDTRCGTLSINEVGVREETGSGTVQDCW